MCGRFKRKSDKDAMNGPEIRLEFTDETVFSVCLKTEITVQTKSDHGPGERLRVIKDQERPTTQS